MSDYYCVYNTYTLFIKVYYIRLYIQLIITIGEFKQEIHHKKLTQLPDTKSLSGICLLDGELWVAARSSGLRKFTVK